jgi:hypothetical protein
MLLLTSSVERTPVCAFRYIKICAMNQETFDALKLIIAVFGGGVVAAVIAHCLAIRRDERRDREQRKREFRGYLAELRSRVERIPHTPDKVPELFGNYTSLIHAFHRERAKVTGDFLPVTDFIRLSEHLGRLRYEAITQDPNKRNPRDVIAEAIDALIKFTDAA